MKRRFLQIKEKPRALVVSTWLVAVCSVQCAVCSVQCAVCSVQCLSVRPCHVRLLAAVHVLLLGTDKFIQ